MKQFALVFRMDIMTPPSPEQMQQYMVSWTKWMNSIAGRNRLAGGNHFSATSARTVYPKNIVVDGPYTVNAESVAGYIIVFAEDIDDAVSIARECPILEGEGTSVEVREIEQS